MFRSPSSSSSSSSGWARHQRCMCFNLIILVIISNLMVFGNAWSWTNLERRSTTIRSGAFIPRRRRLRRRTPLFQCEDDNDNNMMQRKSIAESSSPPWRTNVWSWINHPQKESSENYDTNHDKLPGEIRIRRALPSDVRVTADLLTQVFFRNNTNVFTYAWEWCFTFLSMDSDFPQPPATRRRIPQDILIAEYVLKSSSKSNAKGIIVEAVGMVQVDGRLERMPWKQSLSLTHTQTIMGPQDVIVTSSHHYHNNHSSTAFLQQQQVERPVYLCNLAVLESWRRRGIATQLIQACEALVSINGEYQQPTMLCLKVRRNMPHVVAMYEKLGYAMFQPPAVVVIQGLRKQSTSSRLVEDTNQDHDSIWWMAKSLPTVEEETTTTDTTNVVPETQFVTAPEE